MAMELQCVTRTSGGQPVCCIRPIWCWKNATMNVLLSATLSGKTSLMRE